ncbi:acyltransferase family protein [Rubritalea halochordaticola]|uniref:acyltransferase family protein n=1 Tax=Rubritalea halochordaticola TaxID=714537 RepID=UPI0031FC50B1
MDDIQVTEALEPSAVEKEERKSKRLRSLDALRGFDMFWIVGGSALVASLAKFTQWPWLERMAQEFQHAKWVGFTFYDLIFPLFLFLAGVAMPYSLGGKLEQGASKLRLTLKVFKRVLLLVLLGIVYNGGLALKPLAETRICSVLGFIGVAYGIAALVFIYSKPRFHIAWVIGVLMGYWISLQLFGAPFYEGGTYTPEGSLAGYVDRNLLPWKVYALHFDPEGVLGMISAAALPLGGAIVGQLLRADKPRDWQKVMVLLLAVPILFGIAALWSGSMPFIKKMWTSSFVVHCMAWSVLLTAVFYLVIDVLGLWRWSYFFIIIGLNPITIYLGTRIIDFWGASQFLFGGLAGKYEQPLQGVILAAAYCLTWWMVLWAMHRKKMYLRV